MRGERIEVENSVFWFGTKCMSLPVTLLIMFDSENHFFVHSRFISGKGKCNGGVYEADNSVQEDQIFSQLPGCVWSIFSSKEKINNMIQMFSIYALRALLCPSF